jgi:hypothetical protein
MNEELEMTDIAETEWLAAISLLMNEWLSTEDDEAYADL